MDYSMHLYHLEKKRDTRPYDMEEPNFFGLSISYDPYKQEVIGADSLTGPCLYYTGIFMGLS